MEKRTKPESGSPANYRFGGYRLDPKDNNLWFESELVSIPPKSLEVLVVLLERSPSPVSREELLNLVWKDTAVEEGSLNVSVSNLRKVLGENCSDDIEFVRTIPRKGYQFAVEVEKEVPAPAQNTASPTAEPGSDSLSRWAFAALIGIGLLFVTSFSYWLTYGDGTKLSPIPTSERTFRSLAVLPPTNVSKEYETLALGLSDNLIGRLGRLNRFAVRPLSTVAKFDGEDAIGFAKKLKVDVVLVGSYQASDNRIRVNMRLLDTRDGAMIWSGTFDEKNTEIFKLQDSIASKVAHAVIQKITRKESEILAARSTDNEEAYRLYLLGLEQLHKRDMSNNALGFFVRATELDPAFSLAHLGVADHYALVGKGKKAEISLLRAIELDPLQHDAFATRGFVRMFYYWDWDGAEGQFRKSLDLMPNSSKAHHWYGVLLSLKGRHEEARAEMNKAVALNPSSLIIATDIAETFYFEKNFEEAESRVNEVLRIDPKFGPALIKRDFIREKMKGSYAKAKLRKGIERALRDESGRLSKAELDRISAYKELLETENDKKIIDAARSFEKNDGAKSNQHWYDSIWEILKGENEKALDSLEKSFAKREFLLPFVAVDPLWDPVRKDPRFVEIFTRMKLIKENN
ncbi:MAG: hypothetical protein HKN33_15920 [Pyrinomonadaceae bacterium]|nr:hypothetical protein [Pyrinomonadaceae bacterium]